MLTIRKSVRLLTILVIVEWCIKNTLSALTAEPDFSGPIINVTAPLGREAILTCNVHNLSSYKVAWLRVDTQTILTIHTHIISRSRRVGVTHSDNRSWFLHIKDLKESDRGWYMCQINTDPMKSQLGFLDIVVPPDILDYGTSSDLTVREGSSITLTCATSGYPSPQITWRREHAKVINSLGGNQVTTVEGPMLNISRISRQHAGAYFCIASNGIPPTVSKRIMLTVEFPPVITIRNQLVGASLGSDLELECTSTGYPKPVSYWSRENGDLLPLGTHIEPQKLDGVFKTILRLPIKKVTQADYGSYKCVSKNSLGDTEGTIKLYPISPSNLESNKNEVRKYNAAESTAFGSKDFRLQDPSNGTPLPMSSKIKIHFLISLNSLILILQYFDISL